MTKNKFYSVCVLTAIASLSLSSCQSTSSELWPDSWGDTSGERPSQKQMVTPVQKKSSSVSSKGAPATVSKGVVLPATYYLAEGKPVSHQVSDTTWVDKQDSAGYTIQLADNDNAPQVAQTLQKAPKNARMAQVQYNDNGKSGYIGVYGTYATKEEADAALAKLPANLQTAAKVEPWSTVQEKTTSSFVNTSEQSIAPPDITDMSE